MDYGLITAAYNEEEYIAKTIESVLNQSILPALWVIVSDCSTDGTDRIIGEYESKYCFIKFVRRDDKEKKSHNFASKVHALNLALGSIEIDKFEYIGILDADIILPKDYYECLNQKMHENPKQGVAGGMIYEFHNGQKKLHDISLNTVIGSIQFIRSECLNAIGKFLPMKFGGEDSMLCIHANYLGWETKSFTDIEAQEQKYIGRAKKSLLKARIDRGKGFYDMGYHPIFFIVKCIYRIKDKPVLIGSLTELWIFLKFSITGVKKTPSEELVKFLRKEQMKRFKHIFNRKDVSYT